MPTPNWPARRARWLRRLSGERRVSPLTLDAYARDLRQFLAFAAKRLGGNVTLAALPALKLADIRAFMAQRREQEVSSRSLMRQLAGLRSFARHLGRENIVSVDVFSKARSPETGARAAQGPAGRHGARTGVRRGRRADAPGLDCFARRRCARAALWRGPAHFRSPVDPAPDAPVGPWIPSSSRARAARRAPRRSSSRSARRSRPISKLCPHHLAPDGPLVRRGARRAAVAAHHPADGRAAARARWACRIPPRPMRCAIPSPPTCSGAAATCARSRSCSATPACPPRRSIRPSTSRACLTRINPPIRELGFRSPRRCGRRRRPFPHSAAPKMSP